MSSEAFAVNSQRNEQNYQRKQKYSCQDIVIEDYIIIFFGVQDASYAP